MSSKRRKSKRKKEKKSKRLLGGLVGFLLKLVACAVFILALGSIATTLWGPTIGVRVWQTTSASMKERTIPIPNLGMVANYFGFDLNFGNPEAIAEKIAQTAQAEREKILGPATATPVPTSTPAPTPTPVLDPNWPFPDGNQAKDNDGDENINVNPEGQLIRYSGDLLSKEPNELLDMLANTLGTAQKVQQMTTDENSEPLGVDEWEQILIGLNPDIRSETDIKIPPWRYARRLWEENYSQMPTVSRTTVGEGSDVSGEKSAGSSPVDEPPVEPIERGIQVLKGAKKYIGTNRNEPSKFQHVGDLGEDTTADLYIDGGTFCLVNILSGAHPGTCWVTCEHVRRGPAAAKGNTSAATGTAGAAATAVTATPGAGTLGENEAMILNFEGDCWLTNKGKICSDQRVPASERALVHPGQIVYLRPDGLWGPAKPRQ